MRKMTIIALAFLAGALFFAPLSAVGGGKNLVPFHTETAGYLLPFNFDRDDIAARCPDTPEGKLTLWISSFEGSGTATHTGLSYVTASHCSYGVYDEVNEEFVFDGTYGQGRITITAANGDVLLANYDDGISYEVEPGLVAFMDTITFIDGGTGRFKYASGGAVEKGTVSFVDYSFTVEMNGMISYSRR